ncbi:hypothetical protein K439DRAFT_1640739, partial [Ramaria rubella]
RKPATNNATSSASLRAQNGHSSEPPSQPTASENISTLAVTDITAAITSKMDIDEEMIDEEINEGSDWQEEKSVMVRQLESR